MCATMRIPKNVMKIGVVLVEMRGLEPPTPYMRSKRRSKARLAYETQEIAHFPCCAGLFGADFSFASVRAFASFRANCVRLSYASRRSVA